MTIDQLRARKRELLARKKYEEQLQAAGEGDNLALFMVKEELLDVNDQLKALTAGRRKSGGRAVSADFARDRQQYMDWRRQEMSLDSEIKEGRSCMKAAAVHGLDLLSPHQREVLELYLAGQTVTQISTLRGVNQSTVSRTLARAKKRVREETERALVAQRIQVGEKRVDLNDPTAAKAVLLAMTPKQTVYFYLYYSEYQTLREISALTGTDHTAVMRTIRRALRNIAKLLGGQAALLEHPEALEDLAYQAYCEIEDHPELLPESIPKPVAYCPARDMSPSKQEKLLRMEDIPIRIRREVMRARKPPGKLLAALLARQDQTRMGIFQWLEAIFTAFQRKLRKKKKEAAA